MIIRIDKCTTPGAWYERLVGQAVRVERHEINRDPSQGLPEDVYWCREGGTYNALNWVRVSDATLLGAASLKAAISGVLQQALDGSDPNLRLDGRYIRWGLVEKRIHNLVDDHLSAR